MKSSRLAGASGAATAPAYLGIIRREGESAGYELRLALGDEMRVLRDPDCRVLFRTAIVITAAAARGADGAPTPAAPPPEPPEPALPPTPAPAPTVVAPTPAPSARPLPPPRWATTPRERRSARVARARYAEAAARADADAANAPPPAAPASPAPPRDEGPADLARENGARGAVHWGADAGVGISSGVLPDLGAALELGARFEQQGWGAALSLRYWPQRSGSREGRGFDLSALGGRAAALFRIAPALNALVGLELNRLEGEGPPGVSGRDADVAWQLAPVLGASLIAWDIQDLRIEIGAAGRLSLLRPRFVVTGFGDLYRVPVLGGDVIIRGVWLFR